MTNGKEENRKRVAKEKGTRENPWRVLLSRVLGRRNHYVEPKDWKGKIANKKKASATLPNKICRDAYYVCTEAQYISNYT